MKTALEFIHIQQSHIKAATGDILRKKVFLKFFAKFTEKVNLNILKIFAKFTGKVKALKSWNWKQRNGFSLNVLADCVGVIHNKLGLFKAERLNMIIDCYYHFYYLRFLYDNIYINKFVHFKAIYTIYWFIYLFLFPL